MTTEDVRDQLKAYLAGGITLGELARWLSENEGEGGKNNLLHLAKLRLAEYDLGNWTFWELREQFRRMLGDNPPARSSG